MATQTEENYLKALFQLSSEDGQVGVSQLSQYLEISKPTANSMIKNLKQQGLVIYEKYKPLLLTENGKKAAALIIRKHRLTEMYLVEKMGFGWNEVHEIAEQIEHIKSPVFFDRMDELMDYPKFDPHGSPIPDKNGHIVDNSYVPLNECRAGDQVILAALSHSSKEFLDFLDSRELSLGQLLSVQEVTSFDNSVTVKYSEKIESLSEQVSQLLLVKPA